MNQTILFAILTLSFLGVVAAIILYFIAQKFKVIEDPRIDIVNDLLPGANCGGCGLAGCRALAEALVKTGDLSKISCPVGGNETMNNIAAVLGLVSEAKEPMIAVVRCNGSKVNAASKVIYDSTPSCAFAHYLSAGETGCPNGCLGNGDCVSSCLFDALVMDPVTGLPTVIADKCVACGKCVTACPRTIIELRPKGKKDKRIFVSCINKEKGAIARKNCSVACIGCGKCVKECSYDAITMNNNLAYIDYDKCKLCRKCVASCPTGAIWEINFPLKKDKIDNAEIIAPTEIVI